MYNGIGLATARGSGTNAYVQKNLSFTNKLKQKVEYKTEEDIRKLEATVNRPANQAILAHQRKRQIELKCLEMREKMEEEGYSEEEIGKKVAAHRETLTAKAEEAARMKEMLFKFDENGRPFVKETHQMAEINQERNDKLKRALGINDNFVEGSSLDIDRRSKEIVEKTEPNDHQIRDNTFSPVLSTKSHSKKIVEYNETKEVDTQKTEKNKEKKIEQKHRESDNEMPVKDIPKKYAYDDRKRSKRSRSRDKHTSKKDQSRILHESARVDDQLDKHGGHDHLLQVRRRVQVFLRPHHHQDVALALVLHRECQVGVHQLEEDAVLRTFSKNDV
ncbi:hypothetical protein B4U80_00615 [Leptotrombidium deliense]|uniref:CWF21 domain-containing protein n=1 Tax=Leptotrombidium deliense TaxID=299467 RepID=A0A443SRR4_9ACAR|nr:hypothetical protein B4U80_00615 [Leptotrombidium deliense]